MKERIKLPVASYLFLIRDEKILLLRRQNTGYLDGMYSLPAGHIEAGETVSRAMVREAQEEIGITFSADDVTVVHVVHRAPAPGGSHEYIDFYFTLESFEGTPINNEPHKCDHMEWFKLDELPDNTIPYIASAITNFRKGQLFSEFGWKS